MQAKQTNPSSFKIIGNQLITALIVITLIIFIESKLNYKPFVTKKINNICPNDYAYFKFNTNSSSLLKIQTESCILQKTKWQITDLKICSTLLDTDSNINFTHIKINYAWNLIMLCTIVKSILLIRSTNSRIKSLFNALLCLLLIMVLIPTIKHFIELDTLYQCWIPKYNNSYEILGTFIGFFLVFGISYIRNDFTAVVIPFAIYSFKMFGLR